MSRVPKSAGQNQNLRKALIPKLSGMPALAQPVLTLAMGNLASLVDAEQDIHTIWGLFTKVKDNLENGHRLENVRAA